MISLYVQFSPRRVRSINQVSSPPLYYVSISPNHLVQFHTGLGDNDISLLKSNPAHLQPVINAYPQTKFVLLHSSYPFTQEAGYLCSVYKNVYLDFGEIWPFVSGEGQRTVIRQLLELCPTNKILWSSTFCIHDSRCDIDVMISTS